MISTCGAAALGLIDMASLLRAAASAISPVACAGFQGEKRIGVALVQRMAGRLAAALCVDRHGFGEAGP